jgi:outer membrane protein OmpA-like peptidoglycan-associated protein
MTTIFQGRFKMKSGMNWLWVLLCTVAGIIVLPMTAQADYPNHGVYIGVYGGYMLKYGTWNFGSEAEAARPRGILQPKSPPLVGLRLGFHFLPQLIGEVGGAFLPLTSTEGGKNTGLKADFDLYYHLLSGDNSPFVGLGAGAFALMKGGDLGGDADMQAHVSLGVRGLLTRSLALRAEVRDYTVRDYSKIGWCQNIELTAGLDFYLSGAEKKILSLPPSDRDNDGIPDSIDQCPDQAGPKALNGCPDRDGDGIADKDDQCPDQAGPLALHGCPDRDGDGVADKDDQCPDQAGLIAIHGCPDRDGDGIADKDDRCPDQAGPIALHGCPDRDGDGVPDIDDSCPDQRGLPEYHGCLPEAVKKFTGAIKGINFKTGSATILPNSFMILDQAVMVLQQYKSLRIRVEGHTDNVGDAEVNQKLSESRAESVKTYFMSKGIDFSRIETAGYGDSRSVESNKTGSGRAANRRIEFTVLGQQ